MRRTTQEDNLCLKVHPPSTRPYGRHVFLCSHGDCAPTPAVVPLQQRFVELLRTHGLTKLRNPQRVKCTLADCLGVCAGGPILVVYPEGVWYHHVDVAALERIFHEHILHGQPVDELIFHRLYPPGQEPPYAPAVRGDQPLEEPTAFTAVPYEEEPGLPEQNSGMDSDTDEAELLSPERYQEKATRRQASYLRKKGQCHTYEGPDHRQYRARQGQDNGSPWHSFPGPGTGDESRHGAIHQRRHPDR